MYFEGRFLSLLLGDIREDLGISQSLHTNFQSVGIFRGLIVCFITKFERHFLIGRVKTFARIEFLVT